VPVSVQTGTPVSHEIAWVTHAFSAGSLQATPGMQGLKSQVAVALPLGPQLIV
jgi:hypothetical protein